jgi:ABC-type transport system substrate-binding protein
MRSLSRCLGMLIVVMMLAPAHLAATAAPAHKATGACATQAKKKPSGSIRISDWQFPSTLNPVQTNLASANLIGQLQNDDLLRYDSRGHLYPILLQRVPSQQNGGISRDGKTIYLYLKHGVDWSNGQEVTSRQIWFAWKVSMDKLSGPACRGTCDRIASISTPNKYEAVLHMKSLYASAVPRALPDVLIEQWQSPHGGWSKDNVRQAAFELYQDPGFSYTASYYPTTGPYQVTSFQLNKQIVLKPNPHYNDMTCGAQIARLVFTSYKNKTAMISAAAGHKTDITQNYHLVDLKQLQRHTSAYHIYDVPAFVFEHLEFNIDSTFHGHANPLSNHSVRLALALSVDKVGMIHSVLGVNTATAKRIVANSMWIDRPGLVQPYANTAITGQWDPIAHRYVQPGSSQALRDARKLLGGTQWKHGFSLAGYTSKLYYRTRAMAYIARNWARLGVRLHTTPQNAATLLGSWDENGTLDRGNFQVALFSWVGSPDPDSWRNELAGGYIDRKHALHSDINENFSGFKDGVIDSALRAGSGTYNHAVRATAYKKVQAEMNQQAYWVGLYFGDSIATDDGHVKGFSDNPTTAGVGWNGYNWRT